MTTQKQHVDLYRKLLLRRQLLAMFPERARKGEAIYVPFIGDGDIAAELYAGLTIYGADLDPARVATAAKRLPGAMVRVADCNGWPFPDVEAEFAAADFDAYSNPYDSFRAFWAAARKARRLALFFTDGQRQAVIRTGRWHEPSGEAVVEADLGRRRQALNMWWARHVLPWFIEAVRPWRLVRELHYLRQWMLYWGAVIER